MLLDDILAKVHQTHSEGVGCSHRRRHGRRVHDITLWEQKRRRSRIFESGIVLQKILQRRGRRRELLLSHRNLIRRDRRVVLLTLRFLGRFLRRLLIARLLMLLVQDVTRLDFLPLLLRLLRRLLELFLANRVRLRILKRIPPYLSSSHVSRHVHRRARVSIQRRRRRERARVRVQRRPPLVLPIVLHRSRFILLRLLRAFIVISHLRQRQFPVRAASSDPSSRVASTRQLPQQPVQHVTLPHPRPPQRHDSQRRRRRAFVFLHRPRRLLHQPSSRALRHDVRRPRRVERRRASVRQHQLPRRPQRVVQRARLRVETKSAAFRVSREVRRSARVVVLCASRRFHFIFASSMIRVRRTRTTRSAASTASASVRSPHALSACRASERARRSARAASESSDSSRIAAQCRARWSRSSTRTTRAARRTRATTTATRATRAATRATRRRGGAMGTRRSRGARTPRRRARTRTR